MNVSGGAEGVDVTPDDFECCSKPTADPVNEPQHYGGSDNPYEVFKVVEAWGLDHDAYLFNVIKYVARADKKGKRLEDLKKARVYLDRRISRLEAGA